MRPFNPDVEDIDQYLEEAKERGIYISISDQEKLKKYANKVYLYNQKLLEREEKSIQEQRLKKGVEKDEKEEKEYKKYLYEFDKKNKKGQYDSKNIKNAAPSPPVYTGWEPRM